MRRALLSCIALVAAPSHGYAEPVTCADGTTSEPGRGACSHHGGIAKTRESRGVRCTDGTLSKSTGRGACSRHGGIADDGPINFDRLDRHTRTHRQDTRTPRREPRVNRPWWGSDEPLPGEPIARCVDGTLSYSKHHRGTCTHHGGVREWLDD